MPCRNLLEENESIEHTFILNHWYHDDPQGVIFKQCSNGYGSKAYSGNDILLDSADIVVVTSTLLASVERNNIYN